MNKQIRNKILALLDQHRIMTIATLRPDGTEQLANGGGGLIRAATHRLD
jgi:hypothetical protein